MVLVVEVKLFGNLAPRGEDLRLPNKPRRRVRTVRRFSFKEPCGELRERGGGVSNRKGEIKSKEVFTSIDR